MVLKNIFDDDEYMMNFCNYHAPITKYALLWDRGFPNNISNIWKALFIFEVCVSGKFSCKVLQNKESLFFSFFWKS